MATFVSLVRYPAYKLLRTAPRYRQGLFLRGRLIEYGLSSTRRRELALFPMMIFSRASPIAKASLLTLFLLQSAYATELVVNQRHPQASDRNPGTKRQPLKTISAAAARVKAGDHVTIHAGEYRETVIVKSSGTADAPIAFEAAPNEVAVIKGSDVITGWTRTSPNVWRAKLPPIGQRSNKADDVSFWRTNDVRQVFIKDGIFLDAVRLRAGPPDGLVAGQFYCDQANNDLYVGLEESADANRLTIEASVRGAWLYVFGHDVVIRRLQMRHASTIAVANWPACSLKGDNVALEDCQLTWGDFIGAGLEANHDRLTRCTFSCNGNSGLGGSGNDHVIESCRFTFNNTDRYDPAWHAGGAKLIPHLNRSRIVHNEFAHNLGPGLWLDESCNENLIEGNFCHDNEGPGIMVEISAGNRVFNNVCYLNRNLLSAEFLRPDPNFTSRGIHNVFVRGRRDGQPAAQPFYHAGDGRGIYVSSSPETKVYHNTSYLNEGEGICVEGDSRMSFGVGMSTRGCKLLNNIAVYNKGTQLVIRRTDNPDTRDNDSDYNLIAAAGAVFAQSGWNAPFTLSLKQWQESSKLDAHSIQSDPVFAMAAMGDFRLLPFSPAAGKGLPLNEVPDDFFGDRRPEGRVSIGACEVTAFDYPRPFELELRPAPR